MISKCEKARARVIPQEVSFVNDLTPRFNVYVI